MKLGGMLPLALLLCSCGETQAEEQLPPLPEPALRPLQEHFENRAEEGPSPPSPERLAELREMVDAAFHPESSGERLAARIKRSLLQEKDAFWALEEALAHEDAQVRSTAAYELGELGHRPSILPLLLRLKYEQDPATLHWVVRALHALGNDAGLPWLIWLTEQPDHARLAGATAIDVCRAAGIEPGESPTWQLLRDELSKVHRYWLEHGVPLRSPPAGRPEPSALIRARIAAHLSVLQGYQLRPVDEAKFALSRAGALAVPQLALAVQAEEPYLRTVALELVAEVGPPARPAAPHVLPLLSDELTASYAARALGELRVEEAVPHLLRMLESEDLELRAAAAGALGPLGDPSAVPHLERILADEQEAMDVRVQAAFSLALFELQRRPAYRFLQELRAGGAYHEATLDEILERIDARAR